MGGALINKTALQNTPKEVLSWYIYFAAMIIATSGGLHGYNSSNMSGILKVSSGRLQAYISRSRAPTEQ